MERNMNQKPSAAWRWGGFLLVLVAVAAVLIMLMKPMSGEYHSGNVATDVATALHDRAVEYGMITDPADTASVAPATEAASPTTSWPGY